MGNYNRWIGMGNLTRDPELREAGEGRVAKFGLAVNRDYPVKETLFIDVEAWNRQADTIMKYFHKGDPILVDGRLRLDQWEKDGQKHSKILVVLENFEFVGPRRDRDRGTPADGGRDDQDAGGGRDDQDEERGPRAGQGRQGPLPRESGNNAEGEA